jgi:predicted PurR-regulated permease PerM
VGAYINSELFQSILAGALLWLGYWSMGLQYPALLSVAGALAWLVPWLGAALAVIPPFLAGLGISGGVGALAAIYTLMVLFVMEFVVEPRFFPRQRFSSLLLVLVVVAFAQAYGLVGLILAPPFAAALQIFFSHYARLRSLPGDRNGALNVSEDIARHLADLKGRAAELQTALADEPELGPEKVNLIQRLNRLVEATDTLLRDRSGLR